MLIYKLEVDVIGDDWKNKEEYLFTSYDERELFKKEYKNQNSRNSIYSNNTEYCFYDETVSFEEAKNTMTISQYEKLFNTNLKANNKLELEDLETGMIVWNETQEEYQKVRYVSTHDIKNYHWCDGWGNNIENDELYTYKLN